MGRAGGSRTDLAREKVPTEVRPAEREEGRAGAGRPVRRLARLPRQEKPRRGPGLWLRREANGFDSALELTTRRPC